MRLFLISKGQLSHQAFTSQSWISQDSPFHKRGNYPLASHRVLTYRNKKAYWFIQYALKSERRIKGFLLTPKFPLHCTIIVSNGLRKPPFWIFLSSLKNASSHLVVSYSRLYLSPWTDLFSHILRWRLSISKEKNI